MWKEVLAVFDSIKENQLGKSPERSPGWYFRNASIVQVNETLAKEKNPCLRIYLQLLKVTGLFPISFSSGMTINHQYKSMYPKISKIKFPQGNVEFKFEYCYIPSAGL